MTNTEALELVNSELMDRTEAQRIEPYTKLALDLTSVLAAGVGTAAGAFYTTSFQTSTCVISAIGGLVVSRVIHRLMISKCFKTNRERIEALQALRKQLENGINIFESVDIESFQKELEKYMQKK